MRSYKIIPSEGLDAGHFYVVRIADDGEETPINIRHQSREDAEAAKLALERQDGGS